MFCPKCGHQQSSDIARFCARCGFSLEMVAGLLADSDRQFQHEQQEITGIGWLMATLLSLFNFILIFGLVTLPHLVNPVFLIIWLSFLIMTLTMGGIGLTKLVRSGFFSRLKERELQLELAKAGERRLALSEKPGAADDLDSLQLRLAEHISVTEGTTRSLSKVAGAEKRE